MSLFTFLIVTFNTFILYFFTSFLYLSRKLFACSVGTKYSWRISVVCGSGFCRKRTGTAMAVFLLTVCGSTSGDRYFSTSQRKNFPKLLALDAWNMTLRSQILFSPASSSFGCAEDLASAYVKIRLSVR